MICFSGYNSCSKKRKQKHLCILIIPTNNLLKTFWMLNWKRKKKTFWLLKSVYLYALRMNWKNRNADILISSITVTERMRMIIYCLLRFSLIMPKYLLALRMAINRIVFGHDLRKREAMKFLLRKKWGRSGKTERCYFLLMTAFALFILMSKSIAKVKYMMRNGRNNRNHRTVSSWCYSRTFGMARKYAITRLTVE